MFGLYRQFTIGRYTKAFLIKDKKSCTSRSNLKAILKEAFKKGLIDSAIGTTLEKNCENPSVKPVFIKSLKEIDSFEPFFFIHGGQNSILKEITQKYSFEKLGVIGHSCILDGINKMQYYGIGSNFAVLKFSLKIGIGCIGALSLEGMNCLLKEKKLPQCDFDETFFKKGRVFISKKEPFAFSIEEYYYYLNEGCKVCMNLSSRGSDLTFVPYMEDGYSLCFVRTKKGLKLFENPDFEVKEAQERNITEVEETVKQVLKKNIENVLERAELGVPSNKWDGNRFGKFSALWNNIYAENIEEEVF
ncbi:Coenzyme F420 hydrogenase/dehydrogenase, beta subunit C-terminal domain [Desulfurobacterium atlanticum]|uniref:Coenzyme F420-reducing hydrogenase, beta subunit n=1 Tax=Desulfurobacterium atlanticum TaxID=240169 RepID=A0A238ZRW9_9BACT|nr:Coenzyme F420 hydrogenase/dehydrogenase, beta subunit C-terminal domain [Desulfurobacterium atlanticum]SNR85801.1 coenzyme F420-reducing hydrogenase, beta subunit [Desulfurobacterium atlanticum]